MTSYTKTGKPVQGSRGISKQIRDEFALIESAVNSKANINSPAFTGIPSAPTATVGTTGTQVATLDFVIATSFTTNLPGQAGNAGKGLTTDGTNASWSDKFMKTDTVANMSKPINHARASVIASATSSDIWGANGNEIDFSGTATITDFPDAPQAGASRVLHISGNPTFTNNANIFLQNSANYTAEPGDIAIVHAVTASTFRIIFQQINGSIVRKLPIFGASSLNKVAVSSGEDIASQYFSTGLASGNINVVYGLGLFVAYTSASSSYVATSTDGEVWTLRAMPSAAIWRVGYSNSKFLASASGSTTMASSTNGTVWSSATSLPGNAASGTSIAPVGILNVWIIYSTGTTYYRSTDAGVTWNSATLPVTGGMFLVCGTNFVSATQAGVTTYTSSTGATSSWSSGAVPSGGDSLNVWRNSDASLGVVATNGTYRSTDGTTWAQVVNSYLTGLSGIALNTGCRFYINGVTGVWSTTSGYSYTFQSTIAVQRTSTRNVTLNNRWSAYDGSSISVIGADSGYVVKISNTLTGLFIA